MKLKENILWGIYVFVIVFIFIWIFKVKDTILDVGNMTGTNDVSVGSGSSITTGIDFSSGDFVGTGEQSIIPSTPIDEVYYILKNGKGGDDFSTITFPPQHIVYSEGVAKSFENYLKNNAQALTIKSNQGYLYIRLHKKLKYMSSIHARQPVSLFTDAYTLKNGKSRRVRGRLNVELSLSVYDDHQEFLYSLDNIPINGLDSNDRLPKVGEQLQIGAVVSDTDGNYIESITFIWKK